MIRRSGLPAAAAAAAAAALKKHLKLQHTANWQLDALHYKDHVTMLIKIQLDATVCTYLFTAKLLYMFQVSQHPSPGVLKTVTAASSTGHNTGAAASLCGLIGK